tara:strand:+ start:93 stop:1445 length:1353 start_codon:yes stop_codon:yes gene_type:complete
VESTVVVDVPAVTETMTSTATATRLTGATATRLTGTLATRTTGATATRTTGATATRMTGATATRTTGATATRMTGATATRTTNATTTSTLGGFYYEDGSDTSALGDDRYISAGSLPAQYNVQASADAGTAVYDVVESFVLSDAESYYQAGGPRPAGLEDDLAATIAANDGLDGRPSAVEEYQLSDAEAYYAAGGPRPSSVTDDGQANRIANLNQTGPDGVVNITTSDPVETFTLSEAESDFADGLGPRPDSVLSDEQALNLQGLRNTAPLDGRSGNAVETFELNDEYAYYASGLGPRPAGISDELAARLTARDSVYPADQASVITYELNEEQSLYASGLGPRPDGLTDAQAQNMTELDGVSYPKPAVESFTPTAEMAAYAYVDPDSGQRGPVPAGYSENDPLLQNLRALDIVEVYDVDEEYEYEVTTTKVVTPASTKATVVTSVATRMKQ